MSRLLPRRGIDVVVFFTNDLFGGEWNAETRLRIETYCQAWKNCGPFYWIASGGLPNRNGLTIAQSIIDVFTGFEKKAQEYLIGIDEIGVDTYTQLEKIKPIFEAFWLENPGYDAHIFAVSDKVHLWNMRRIAKRSFGYELNPLPSPMGGNLTYKVGRLMTEIVRFYFSIIDPYYQRPFCRRMRQTRIERALTRVPGENYFHL